MLEFLRGGGGRRKRLLGRLNYSSRTQSQARLSLSPPPSLIPCVCQEKRGRIVGRSKAPRLRFHDRRICRTCRTHAAMSARDVAQSFFSRQFGVCEKSSSSPPTFALIAKPLISRKTGLESSCPSLQRWRPPQIDPIVSVGGREGPSSLGIGENLFLALVCVRGPIFVNTCGGGAHKESFRG